MGETRQFTRPASPAPGDARHFVRAWRLGGLHVAHSDLPHGPKDQREGQRVGEEAQRGGAMWCVGVRWIVIGVVRWIVE